MEKHQQHGKVIVIGLILAGVIISMGLWDFLFKRGISSGNGNFQHISAKDAHALIQERQGDEDFVILDVRTPAEFQQSHIKNAVNIDYYASTFQSQLQRLDTRKTYLVYCRSGNRSGKTLALLKQVGVQQAYNMQGGIGQWSAQQLPVSR